MKRKESFFQSGWRPFAAWLYLTLCFLDYGARPLLNYFYMKKLGLAEITKTIGDLDAVAQVKAIEIYSIGISPILNEIFHLSFAGIVGVTAASRGFEKVQRLKNDTPDDEQGERI